MNVKRYEGTISFRYNVTDIPLVDKIQAILKDNDILTFTTRWGSTTRNRVHDYFVTISLSKHLGEYSCESKSGKKVDVINQVISTSLGSQLKVNIDWI